MINIGEYKFLWRQTKEKMRCKNNIRSDRFKEARTTVVLSWFYYWSKNHMCMCVRVDLINHNRDDKSLTFFFSSWVEVDAWCVGWMTILLCFPSKSPKIAMDYLAKNVSTEKVFGNQSSDFCLVINMQCIRNLKWIFE